MAKTTVSGSVRSLAKSPNTLECVFKVIIAS